MEILPDQFTDTHNKNQLHEQAGFRSGYSTIVHLQKINKLIEKTLKHNKPLCLAFEDYEKTFECVRYICGSKYDQLSKNISELVFFLQKL